VIKRGELDRRDTMLNGLTAETHDATPIVTVDKAAMPAWLDAYPQHRDWLATVGFKGEPGTHAFLPPHGTDRARVVAAAAEGEAVWSFAGLASALSEGRYRLMLGWDAAATDIALGWALDAYRFTAYKAAKRAPATLVWPDGADRSEVERVGGGVCLARDLINTPAEDMGPEEIERQSRALASEHGAAVSAVVGDDLLAQNYPTIHRVGRASRRAPRLIDFAWGDAQAPRVTLVGKGVCFDTGGLNLKPRDGMLEMKKDMGGAAVMLGLAHALMAARAPIRLRVLIAAVDNAVADNAMRPRDIVRTRSGKTVEIGDTDAEGRLILCDALAEADSESPELLIDCATLTGAAKIALGTELQAFFCDDDAAAADLFNAARASGDPLWRLPIWRPYRKQIDSPCADMNNVGKGAFGGAILAALFLAQFVSKAKCWAHLDIFAANATSRPGRPEGGEATGLRALYRFIRGRYPH
jgi:leucyl aminopeptidase